MDGVPVYHATGGLSAKLPGDAVTVDRKLL